MKFKVFIGPLILNLLAIKQRMQSTFNGMTRPQYAAYLQQQSAAAWLANAPARAAAQQRELASQSGPSPYSAAQQTWRAADPYAQNHRTS